MYNKKKLKNISALKHIFGIGQDIYYASLIPSFDWFENQYNIEILIEPIKTTIQNYTLMPDIITDSDKLLIGKIDFSDIIRKYILRITLELGYDITLNVYEARNKEVLILSEINKIISHNLNLVLIEFVRLIFTTYESINYDSKELTIIIDSNYKKFKSLYFEFKETYPDELIKIYANNKIKM